MTETTDSSIIYKLEDGYRITRVSGSRCALVLRKPDKQIAAVLDACDNKITDVSPYRNTPLTDREKHILHKFVRSQKYMLTPEAAEALNLSVLQYDDGREEYLSERQLQKRLKERLLGVRLKIGKLKRHTLRIPAFSKGGIYNLSKAEIRKLVIEKNCDLLIDLRDNKTIEALRVHENFTGSINMSRNTVESIELANNCRCDLTVIDSLKCFNLIIADVYSGTLNIQNSCFHSVGIGFYCYAVIKMRNNWGRRDIHIGDSFRGNLTVDDTKVYELKIGKDCKGRIVLSDSAENSGLKRLSIADEFAGTLDLREAHSLERMEIGEHARGRVNLLGCPGIKIAKFDKYFNGYADFSESAVEYIRAGYGFSGEMVLLNCDNLALLKLPRDQNASVTIERSPLNVKDRHDSIYYSFSDKILPPRYFTPFYKKVYTGIRNVLS